MCLSVTGLAFVASLCLSMLMCFVIVSHFNPLISIPQINHLILSLMSQPLPSRANEHLAMGKLKLNVAMGLLTSHTTLRAHMIKLGLT